MTIPLTFLAYSYFIVNTFQSFSGPEIEPRHPSRETRLGTFVPLHHAVILFAYVLFFLSPSLNLSFPLIRSAFLTLPFALFQIFLLRNISLGAKPNWILLHATSLAVFGLTTYFLTLTIWLR